MKLMKILLMSIIALVAVMVLYSCSQDEEVYSCNKDVDKWVKENIDEIRSMTRLQWCQLDYAVSAATYVAFTQSQKIDFWKAKLSEVKELNWTKAELAHIQRVEDYIMSNPEVFNGRKLSEDRQDEIEIFFVKWAKYAEKNLRWTKKTIAAIVCTGYKVVDTNGTLQMPSKNESVRLLSAPYMAPVTEAPCNCNKESLVSCILDPFRDCDSSNCKEEVEGCGFLMRFPCDGTCGGL